jgi:hypothetical protein
MKQEAKQLITEAIKAINYDLKIDDFISTRNHEIQMKRAALLNYIYNLQGKSVRRGSRTKGLLTLKEMGLIFNKKECTINLVCNNFQMKWQRKEQKYLDAEKYVNEIIEKIN